MVFQSGEDMRQVRLRLAACRITPCQEMASQPPREKRNIASSKHVSVCGSHFLFTVVIFVSMLEIDQNALPLCISQKTASYINEEDEEGGEDAQSFTTHHDCLLVKQKVAQHGSHDRNDTALCVYNRKPNPNNNNNMTSFNFIFNQTLIYS